MHKYFILMVCLLFMNCGGDEGPVFDTYIIRKGEHVSNNPGFRTFSGDILRFEAIFDESADYATLNPRNQFDNNKLLGFSDCNDLHQRNSARFGWWWNGSTVAITAYCYFDGELTIVPVGNVFVGQQAAYLIEKTPTGYNFSIDGQSPVAVNGRSRNCTGSTSYMLWPYFGGDETAPQDIFIQIKIE